MAESRGFRALCEGLVDYAGLFPPAKLEMQETVERYARYAMGVRSWMLGRLICPASRLEELSERGAPLMPGTFATSGYREHADAMPAWGVSVVADMPIGETLDAMSAFDERHSSDERGLAQIGCVEIRATSAEVIDDAMDAVPDDIQPFFEVPAEGDIRGVLAALAGEDGCAKIRCGGVEASMIPSSERIADFIVSCARAGIAFKATAGLHHPVRAEQALTYEDEPPRAVMHGYVNVFLGAVMYKARRIDEDQLLAVLNETDASAFSFDDDGAGWRDASVGVLDIAKGREIFALSYGSCSFEEPVDDAAGLGWL